MEGCDVCGSGLKPDDRMNFDGKCSDEILLAAYEMLTQAQLQLASAECCLAKLMEAREAK